MLKITKGQMNELVTACYGVSYDNRLNSLKHEPEYKENIYHICRNAIIIASVLEHNKCTDVLWNTGDEIVYSQNADIIKYLLANKAK